MALVRTMSSRADELVQYQLLADHLPKLMDYPAQGSLLYVGANQDRCYTAKELQRAGWHLTLLEIWKENADYYRRQGPFEHVMDGDIRTFETDERFDVSVWWHGPEHLPAADLPGAVARLEAVTGELVVLCCPWGVFVQGPVYGNPHEEHQASLYPAHFTNLGYEVAVTGVPDGVHSNILAWKEKNNPGKYMSKNGSIPWEKAMLVRAVKSFGGVGPWGRMHVSEGQIFELPYGSDWLRAGLVVAVEGAPESAMMASAAPRHEKAGNRPVVAVPGVGHNWFIELEKIGIKTVADLAGSSVHELTKIEGVGQATAKKWLEAAREMIR